MVHARVHMYSCYLLKSCKSTFETGHKTDSRSSYRNDSNDSKILSGDLRVAENVFFGYGVRAVIPSKTDLNIVNNSAEAKFSNYIAKYSTLLFYKFSAPYILHKERYLRYYIYWF